MDFVSLLQSLEGATYEIAAWLMLIPKTLFRVIFMPHWAIDYVNQEWEKKPEDRFDEYLSPVLIWLFLIVLPSALFLDQITYFVGIFRPDYTMKWQDSLVLNVAYALITPLVFVTVVEWFNKKPMKRSSLKRVFYLQCYALTPVQFVLQLFIVFFQLMTISMEGLGAPHYLMNLHYLHIAITYTCIAILTLFYETLLFHVEVKVSWLKAFGYALVSFVVFLLTQFVILAILFIALVIFYLYKPQPM
jgi:hypothetical protein